MVRLGRRGRQGEGEELTSERFASLEAWISAICFSVRFLGVLASACGGRWCGWKIEGGIHLILDELQTSINGHDSLGLLLLEQHRSDEFVDVRFVSEGVEFL